MSRTNICVCRFAPPASVLTFAVMSLVMAALVLSLWTRPALAQMASSQSKENKGAANAGDDPALVSVGLGSFDWNKQNDQGVEARLEYRFNKTFFSFFKPFVAVSATTSTNNFFVGAGLLVDIPIGKHLILTPSFAPQYYSGGNKKLDLDSALEFRSQLELAYRFDNQMRLGVAVSHYSNASLGRHNPGTESALIYYSVPVNFLN